MRWFWVGQRTRGGPPVGLIGTLLVTPVHPLLPPAHALTGDMPHVLPGPMVTERRHEGPAANTPPAMACGFALMTALDTVGGHR